MDKNTKGMILIVAVCLILAVCICIGIANKGSSDQTPSGEQTASADRQDDSQTEAGETNAPAVENGTQSEEAASREQAIEELASSDWVTISLAQDGSSVSGAGVSIEGNEITISQAGNYRVSGSLTEGIIKVKAPETEDVVLALAGVTLTNTTDEAIQIKTAASVVLYLEEGTQNRIQSGEELTIDENAWTEEDDAQESTEETTGGAIHSKTDMIICGKGELSVYGYLNNGIQSRTNLVIEDGTISVTARHNGIKGEVSVTLDGGTVSVLSGGDGVKANDITGEGYGVVYLNGGNVTVESYRDAVQAETLLSLTGGMFSLTTYGEISSAGSNSFADRGWGKPDAGWDMAAETSISTKGLKAGTQLQITGGTAEINTVDDGLHSSGDIMITGGTLSIASEDDGIHADAELTIEGGTIDISKSYEGLEGGQIYLKGGEVSLVATDDGVNVNGGSNSTGFGFGWGENAAVSEGSGLYIQGGTLYVNAGGDGLDSNGSLIMDDGTVIVDGPTSGADGSLDSVGTIQINGGTLLAVGSSGMAQSFGQDSTQCSFMVGISGSWQAGDTISVMDADGNVLFTHDAAKAGNSILFSAPELTQGETYTVTAGTQTTSVTLTSVSTGTGSSGFGGGGFGGGGGKGHR